VVIDTFHVWWDPELATSIAAAGAQGRISCFQICDWLVPMEADPLVSRGMMGDGVIDFGAIASIVDAAGYSGDIEVEIFNETIWATDHSAVLKVMKQRYRDLVSPAIDRSG
jgi:sugar phosphate isomerase/epimerase